MFFKIQTKTNIFSWQFLFSVLTFINLDLRPWFLLKKKTGFFIVLSILSNIPLYLFIDLISVFVERSLKIVLRITYYISQRKYENIHRNVYEIKTWHLTALLVFKILINKKMPESSVSRSSLTHFLNVFHLQYTK